MGVLITPILENPLSNFHQLRDAAPEEASTYRKLLAEKEGLYVGFSAAANVAASVKLLESYEFGKSATLVTVLCDTGLKY